MRRDIFLISALALIAVFVWNGCATSRVIENTRVPEITLDEAGVITFDSRRLKLGKIADAVRAAGFKREQEVNILIPDNPDRALMRAISVELLQRGYTRTVFVKNRKASAIVPQPH